MFRMKQKKNAMNTFRSSLMEGRNILSHRVNDGMKYAQNHIIDLSDYIRKNQSIGLISKRIIKNPSNGLMTIAGLGLIAFGLFRMARK